MSSTKNNIFQFKQFAVDQTGCAMKINTDGSLLGALSNATAPKTILDIGSGTGVVALMLAQRFPDAKVDAVEIEEQAALTSERNFRNSDFVERLFLYTGSFQQFFEDHPDRKYDLIVSNPPFFLDSLKNPDKNKQTARHTDTNFFQELIDLASKHLNSNGALTLILPPLTASLCINLAQTLGLYPQQIINIRSFKESEIHRQLVSLGFTKALIEETDFVIYSLHRQYSEQFANVLKDFFTIF